MKEIELFHLVYKMNFLNNNLVIKKEKFKMFKNRKNN